MIKIANNVQELILENDLEYEMNLIFLKKMQWSYFLKPLFRVCSSSNQLDTA